MTKAGQGHLAVSGVDLQLEALQTVIRTCHLDLVGTDGLRPETFRVDVLTSR